MINKVILQGRLVKDIELKRVGNDGIANTEFTVAWSEKYKEKETKCFLRCKAWRNTAEFLSKYFAKGQEILIEGRMATDEWEDSGEKKSRTICEVEKVHFCGSKSGSDNASKKADAGYTVDADGFMHVPDDIDDELPF